MNLAQLIGEQQLKIDTLIEAARSGGASISSRAPDAEVAELSRRLEAMQRALLLAQEAGRAARELAERWERECKCAAARADQLAQALAAAERELQERPVAEAASVRPSMKGMHAKSCASAICQFLMTQPSPVLFSDLHRALPKYGPGALSAALFELVKARRVLRAGEHRPHLYQINPELVK
jgi:hypothetical protein